MATRAIDDKEAEHEWDCMWREQRDSAATRAGLIRSSAFTRELPRWYGLPDEWHEPLSKLLADERARRKAAAEALAVETERKERAELARLLAKYGAALETSPAPEASLVETVRRSPRRIPTPTCAVCGEPGCPDHM